MRGRLFSPPLTNCPTASLCLALRGHTCPLPPCAASKTSIYTERSNSNPRGGYFFTFLYRNLIYICMYITISIRVFAGRVFCILLLIGNKNTTTILAAVSVLSFLLSKMGPDSGLLRHPCKPIPKPSGWCNLQQPLARREERLGLLPKSDYRAAPQSSLLQTFFLLLRSEPHFLCHPIERSWPAWHHKWGVGQ